MFEEEIMISAANMSMYLVVLESTLLHVEKPEKNKLKNNISVYHEILDVLLQDVMHVFRKETVEAVITFKKVRKSRRCSP
jgi:hypothetical protein